MQSVLLRYATPFITGLFLVSLISGIALFFHIGPRGFHGMHEWLSIVLILPFALHLWKNWRPMSAYFKRASFAIAMVVSFIAAAAFLVPAEGESGRPPVFGFSTLILGGSLSEVAAVIDIEPSDLIASLEAAGFTVGSPDESLSTIAANSGKPDMQIMASLVSLSE
ncbi:DUF4405 domain-containing protein [Donghicola sp. XS_ASV15]|uniref:DUF4405 domain-containing protein n=1 Tax=Donghicola sp. XS_ASV15 TaxID=3241295 RepID=UPI0035164371